jgi:peptidoglycan hydrolase CwlO-like protein
LQKAATQMTKKAATQMTKKSKLTKDNVEKLGQMLGPETTLEEKMRAYQQAGFNIYYMDNSQGERERERECERFSE